MNSNDLRPEVAVAVEALRFGVIGNPVAHSRSPGIHAAFAAAHGIALEFRRMEAPLDGFVATVRRFFDQDGRGLAVTVPFKLEAWSLCETRLTERARTAGAVNCIGRDGDTLFGDNTDGIGLVRDLGRLLDGGDRPLAGARLLLLGAGGAARGVLGPLLATGPRSVVVVNRDAAKAAALVAARASSIATARTFDDVADETFDVVINATSASLAGGPLPLAPGVLGRARLVYDLMYAATPIPFLVAAHRAGATDTSDGLGMLVEQAAEQFATWHGIRPQTAAVLAALRADLVASMAR